MNNLQVGNGYIIFEGLAPDLAQGFGAAGGVGGAGAGQHGGGQVGQGFCIFRVDTPRRRAVAEHGPHAQLLYQRGHIVRHGVADRRIRRAFDVARADRVPHGQPVL